MNLNIKDFDSSLLEINKLLFKGILVLIFTKLNISLQNVLIVYVLIELIMIKIFFICFFVIQMDALKKTMELNI